MTPEQFEQLLARHDWYYAFSDDHSYWVRGEAEVAKIQAILKAHPELEPIYRRWHDKMFSKERGF